MRHMGLGTWLVLWTLALGPAVFTLWSDPLRIPDAAGWIGIALLVGGALTAQFSLKRGCLAGLVQVTSAVLLGLVGGVLVHFDLTHDRETVVMFFMGLMVGLEAVTGGATLAVLLLNALAWTALCFFAVRLDSHDPRALLVLGLQGLWLLLPPLALGAWRARRGGMVDADLGGLNRGLLLALAGGFGLVLVVEGGPLGIAIVALALVTLVTRPLRNRRR